MKRKPLPILVFYCDAGCSLCCRKLIVEADPLDVLREPRIGQECKAMDGHGKIPLTDSVWALACVDPCVFLDGHRCSIYATRPNVCVSFEAGGKKCQELRKADGRPPLQPTPQEATVENRLRAEILEMEDGEEFR